MDDIVIRKVKGLWGEGYSLYNRIHGQWTTKPIKAVKTEKECQDWLNKMKQESEGE